jgi:integrase
MSTSCHPWAIDTARVRGIPQSQGRDYARPQTQPSLSRAVLASKGGGELYVDTLKNKRGRTVPLVSVVVPIVDRWSAGTSPGEWLFAAPAGGPLRETNWQRSVSWREAKAAIGRPELRVHDLRHTAASVWLASGAVGDRPVVERHRFRLVSRRERASRGPVGRGCWAGRLGRKRARSARFG